MGEPVTAMSDIVQRLLSEGHRHIVINLSDVEWLDTSALGELVACQIRARRSGGEIKLVNPSDKTREIIVMVKLHMVFDIQGDELKAVGSF